MAPIILWCHTPEKIPLLFHHHHHHAIDQYVKLKIIASALLAQRHVYECVQQLLKVYRGERIVVPQAPHESWVVNRLGGFLADALHSPQLVGFQPGEYHYQASMHRRNLGRLRDMRRFAGHKVNGVAIAATKKLVARHWGSQEGRGP
ncbi:hypothetical protein EDD21DRAFT_410186 [Dissophora ornata]|nr:hypothetical protein EDD21DRAFT_410186 [Dissophora ornata]